MVDTSNLPQVNSILQRYTTYRQALDIIDNGGSIVAFSVSGNRGFQQISSEGITYPPTMLEAIRDQVQQRATDLQGQLAALGVMI